MSDRKRPPSRLVLGTGAKRSSTTSRADTLLVASPVSANIANISNSSLLHLTKTSISRSLMSATQWSHLDLSGLMETPLHLLQPLLSNTILDVPLLETLSTLPHLRSIDLLQAHWRHHCEQFIRQNPQVPLTKEDDPTESYDEFWRRLMEWHQQKTPRSGNALRELYRKDSLSERHNTKVISTSTSTNATGNSNRMDAVRMRLLNHTKTKTNPTPSAHNTTATITRRIVTKPRLIPPKK